MKKLNRNCSICGSIEGRIIHNQKFVTFQNSPLPNSYDIVICSECGFSFADTPASQEDYNQYYSILSKYEDCNLSSGSGFNENDLWRLNRTADFLGKYISVEDNIMDIGCANGGQLMILKKRGYNKILGIDPSFQCVKNVSLSGISAVQTDIFSKKFEELDQNFDLIILSHVLEHIKDLNSALEIIKKKLNRSGMLYIEVPDASHYCDHFIVPYYYFDCEHINHFSPISLANLLMRSGFRQVDYNQSTIKLNKNINYPVFFSLFQYESPFSSSILEDYLTQRSITEFVLQSAKQDSNGQVIERLVQSQEKIIIWGAGQFSQRILATTNIKEGNIVGFVDSDHSKHGKKIGEFHVYPPEYIIGKEITLLICSALYSEDIVEYATKLNRKINYQIIK